MSIVSDILSSKEPKKRKLNPNIIRIGDTVKIINPVRVIRVGYPMSFDDACEEVKKIYHKEIVEFMNKTTLKQFDRNSVFMVEVLKYEELKLYKKIVKALAYEHIQNKGFGGKEKKIYTEVRQDLLGIISRVENIQIRKTGTYFAPSGGYDYWGEYDFEPGGLDKIKTHKILELDYWVSKINSDWFTNKLCIESCNVEKIHERDSEEYNN